MNATPPAPAPAALRVLHDEHRALAAVLQSIPLLLRECRQRGVTPDFGVLRAMLFYVDEFPEKRHHPFETRLLFPRVRERSAEANALLDQLDDDHARGEQRIRELEYALTAYEILGPTRREAFETAAQEYVKFYLAHMGQEERVVLPLAERVLRPEDWEDLDAAASRHQDPLAGGEPDDEYRALFTRIVNRVPAPIGLGPPLPDAA